MTIKAAGLVEIEAWMRQALTLLGPAARKKLLRDIGRELRKRQQVRMAAQTGPDQTPWASRAARNDAGKTRKTAAMMVKLRQAKRLKITVDGEGVAVGWSGRTAAIAALHHHGGWDYVDKATSDAKANYPARPLIGLPADDVHAVRQIILSRIAAKLPG